MSIFTSYQHGRHLDQYADDDAPKRALAAATDSSKKLDMPIIPVKGILSLIYSFEMLRFRSSKLSNFLTRSICLSISEPCWCIICFSPFISSISSAMAAP